MRREANEQGQTLVLMALFLVVLLGFAALVIEGGNAFVQRRQMQGTADAAAMAGVQQMTSSRADAEAVARDYVDSKNANAGGAVKQLITTSSGSATCGTATVPPYGICVKTTRSQPSALTTLLGSGTTVSAQAIAAMSQVRRLGAWLPFGVMDNRYAAGVEVSFRPGSVAPVGSINAPAGASCTFYGGNGVRDVIESAAHGGADACPIDIGQTIETQTGVTSGIITQGFAGRLGTNTDSFEDVFQYDAVANAYTIKLPNSPRLGVVPLAGGTGDWPLSAGQQMTVVGYSFVYIGDRTKAPSYPAVTGSGNALRIHLTPVNARLPTNWNADFAAYVPGTNNITAYRLVS